MQQATVFELLKYMIALIRAEERKRCTALRLQLIHLEVLNYLSTTDQYTDTPAATADFFGMTRGTVSQSLIVLEKKGYIEKQQDNHDRRIIHVRLLPLGLAILKRAKASRLSDIKYTDQTQKQYWAVLNALQQVIFYSQSFKAGKNTQLNSMKKATVYDLIEHMAALIRSEERKKCTELKLQMVHFQVLDYLSLCNKYSNTPAAIANYLGMTRGTVSQTLIILEKRGYIEKVQDLHDKRVFHIHLLESGQTTLNQAKPTDLFDKALHILNSNSESGQDAIFTQALLALQKANNSYSFGLCKTCKNFTQQSSGYFCQLTQEPLTESDANKICQEHKPI